MPVELQARCETSALSVRRGRHGDIHTPDLNIRVRDGLAGIDIVDAEVEGQGNSLFLIDEVTTNKLASDV